MTTYKKNSWRQEVEFNQTSLLKRGIYFLIRPLLSLSVRQYLTDEIIGRLKPSLLTPGRGMPWEDRMRWGSSLCDIKNSTILVQGAGTGWEVAAWATLKPKRIIAVDLFDFNESWQEIITYVHDLFQVPVEFHQAPLENLSFIPDGSIDLCVSSTVFEHCKNLPDVLKESRRILKPDGCLYAFYGQLWYSAGGDHFSGRGGLENAFNHVLLPPDEYLAYFQEFLGTTEDFQAGGRYVELDLFSKLTTDQYYECFVNSGLTVHDLMIEINPKAIAFKKKYPEKYQVLCARNQHVSEHDLMISGNFVKLLKK
jgi:ubiquinone/menaquinone biosynthesis C-methylase UbiE